MNATVTSDPARRPSSAPAPVRPRHLLPARLRNPWGRPRVLVAVTWLYLGWALLPVAIAMRFSFNSGRSRSVWQGFSIRWLWGDPSLSIFHDPDYVHALLHSLELAALDMAIATPLGCCWRSGWRAGAGAGRAPPTG